MRGLAIRLLALALLSMGGPASAETVKVGISKILAYGDVPIAKDRGYFAAEGIDAELVFFDSAQPVAVAVASGDCDFGMAAATAAFLSLANEGTLKSLAGSNRETPGYRSLAFLASNRAYDAGLTSVRDLSGHSVAITQVGTPLEYALGRVLKKYGHDLDSVRVLPLQSNSNVSSALVGGQVDASTFPVTPATRLIEHGDVKLLAWLGDEAPGLPGSMLFTSAKTANGRADLVTRFVRAYRHAARDYHDAFVGPDGGRRDGPMAPAIIAILGKFAGLTPDQVKFGIPFMEPDAPIDVAGLQDAIDWYAAHNFLKRGIEARRLVDTRYAVLAPSDPR
jgi:NitT/TauT family transport system substrate-binding protein